jgi:hypothetical protein
MINCSVEDAQGNWKSPLLRSTRYSQQIDFLRLWYWVKQSGKLLPDFLPTTVNLVDTFGIDQENDRFPSGERPVAIVRLGLILET